MGYFPPQKLNIPKKESDAENKVRNKNETHNKYWVCSSWEQRVKFLGSMTLVEHLSLAFEFIQNSNVALKAV